MSSTGDGTKEATGDGGSDVTTGKRPPRWQQAHSNVHFLRGCGKRKNPPRAARSDAADNASATPRRQVRARGSGSQGCGAAKGSDRGSKDGHVAAKGSGKGSRDGCGAAKGSDNDSGSLGVARRFEYIEGLSEPVPILTDEEHELNVQGLAIAPNVFSLIINVAGPNDFSCRRLQQFERTPRVSQPRLAGGMFTPCLPVNYKTRLAEMRKNRTENPYIWKKQPTLEYRFWNQFHFDYYYHIIWQENMKSPPISPMQYIDIGYLKRHEHPEIKQLVQDLERAKIINLLGFKKKWNTEIICQFYATYWMDVPNKVLHWMTEGTHYKVDFVTFSWLLGLDDKDRDAPPIFRNSEKLLTLEQMQHMYLPDKVADGTTTYLRPYYYMLNNIFRATFYPKIGESNTLLAETLIVLNKFGDSSVPFSVSKYLWCKIYRAVQDPQKTLPYAPYIMHIIEQVTGIEFPKDTKHKPLKLRNCYSPVVRNEMKNASTTGGHNSFGSRHFRRPPAPAAAPISPHRHRKDGSIQFAIKMMFEAICYKMKRDDQRFQRIEQNLLIGPPSPLREFCDPFVLYREERAAAKAAARATRAPPVDESGPSTDPDGKRATTVPFDADNDDDTTEDEFEDDDKEDADEGAGDDANNDLFE